MKESIYSAYTELPKISIITISFNQSQFLEETIRSVLLQNYPNLEYIVIDGASTDGSVDIIKKYERWMAFWISRKDRGPADALNHGVDKCTGDFVCYLNSDDIILHSGISRFIKHFMRDKSCDVYTGHGMILNAQSDNVKRIYSNTWKISTYLHGQCSIVQQATFIRMSKLNETNGFNTANHTCWDGELLVDLANKGANFKKMNDFIGGFRIHDLSITGSQSSRNSYLEDVKRIRRNNGVYKVKSSMARLHAFLDDPLILLKRFMAKL